jgi:hypothetical protein
VAEEQSGDPVACSSAPSPAGEMLQRIRTRGGTNHYSSKAMAPALLFFLGTPFLTVGVKSKKGV